ncbi:S-layer homology domain-containing protein [Cohnella fermenti]|nr:S-layer homology domain-containing protein [Cohnella fermenti]
MMNDRKANRGMRKGLAALLAGALLFSLFSGQGAQAEEAGTSDLYSSVVSQAGDYAIKQLGESILSDEANAQVVTSDPGAAQGTVYYVSPNGNDSNDGTSQATPWKTVQKVNATTFSPGDMILFQAGGAWELTESLHPKGSGEEGKRIVIGAYGSGAKPKLSAKNIAIPWTFTDGSTRYASDAVYLENQPYIEIRDLDISNIPDGYTGKQSEVSMIQDRRGIHIAGGNNTTQTELKGYWLHDLYVHDVAGEWNSVSGTGWDPSKRTAGILFEIIVKGQDGLPVIANPVDVTGYQPTWFSDAVIENNVLIDNSFGGIIVKQLKAWGERQDASAPSYDYTDWYPNTNFTIQHNYLDHSGSDYAADTIYLTSTRDSIIRNNVSAGAGTSAIELYYTDRITVEWNEVYEAKQKPTGSDSNAIDPDRASTNALIQYNYLHDNGDGILLCGFTYGSAVVRYNVIKDSESGKRYLNIHGNKGHNYIYNNIFYNSRSTAATFVSTSGDKNTFLNDTNNFHYLYNNIFYSPNNASARTDDGTSLTYSNNSYYNVTEVPAEDTAAIVADPKFKAPSSVTGGSGSDVDLSGLELQADSPLISAGKAIASHDNTTIPVGTITDVAGNSITAGGVDIGIYEFVGDDSSIGDLRGYTFDPYGDIKAGVTVTAKAGGQSYTGISDAKGLYSIGGIPAGTAVAVTASMSDYQDSTAAAATIIGADVSMLNLTLGASLLTTGSIAGNVIGIPNVNVTVTDGSGQVVGTAVTTTNGSYVIDNIPVGSGYTVTVQKQDYYDGTKSGIAVQAAHTTVVDLPISRVVKELRYFLNESFNYAEGAFTGNELWNVNSAGGTVDIVKDNNGNSYLKLEKTASSGSVTVWNKNALNATGVFTIETRIMRTAAGSNANQFAIYSGETIDSSGTISAPMADVGISKGNIFTHVTRGSSGTTNFASAMNRWYDIRMVVNMDSDTFDFYIDGELMKAGAQLRTAGTALNFLQIFGSANNTGDLLIDYLWAYEGSPEGDDADIANVTVEELGSEALAYDAGTHTFTSSSRVPFSYDSVKVRVAPSSPFAEVSVNGKDLGRVDDNDYVEVPLAAGLNTIPLIVTAADGSAITYTLELTKQDELVLAYLTELAITELTLDPAFTGTEPDEADLFYTTENTMEKEHTLTYAKATSGSTVTVTLNGKTLAAASPVSVTLQDGLNTIVLAVASASGDQFQTYTIRVTAGETPVDPPVDPPAAVEVTGVAVTPAELTLTEGDRSSLTAVVSPDDATNKAVSWSTSDPSVAEVDENGVVTAEKEGHATITATTQDGSFTATTEVTVEAASTTTPTDPPVDPPATVEVTGVAVTPTELTLTEGDRSSLTAVVAPEEATNKAVSWSTSDSSVAEVDENGVVTAEKEGHATITATTQDGSFTATTEVTVEAASTTTPTDPPVTPPVDNPSSSGGDTTATTPSLTLTLRDGKVIVQATADSSGQMKAELSEADVAKALESATNGVLDLVLDAEGASGQTEITLPVQSFVGNESAVRSIVIERNGVKVELAVADVSGILKPDSEQLTLRVAPIDPATLAAGVASRIGNHAVYEFALLVDGNEPPAFNGTVTVSLSYALQAGESKAGLVVYYIDESGLLQIVKNGKYDAATGSMSFRPAHFSRYAIAYVPAAFGDLASANWAKEMIESLAARGIVNGTGTGAFQPERTVTRAEFLKMLLGALELANVQTAATLPFEDVEPGSWYEEAVSTAYSLGIVQGKSERQFGADDTITREEMAVMLYRAAQAAGVTLKTDADHDAAFGDASAIAKYSQEAVAAVRAAGLMGGFEDGIFGPKQAATRAQAAAVIYRFIAD